jgi:hypothetical protein
MPTYTYVAKFAATGCLVKPLLIQFHLSGAAFKLTLRTARPLERAPDQWFHASAHPGLSVTQLTDYLTLPPPEDERTEELTYITRMSNMFGTIMHEVTRQALVQLGLMVPVRQGTCMACGYPQPRHCREHGASHPATRSRGHLDGILRFGPPGHGGDGYTSDELWGFDLKTIKKERLYNAPDMNEYYFRATWPHYWWQVQEYMRLTGLGKFIVLFQGMGNPWDMREYHVMADPAAALEIEGKYAAALAQAGITP